MGDLPWKGDRKDKPPGYGDMSNKEQLEANITAASSSATEKATNSQNNLNNSLSQSGTLLDANLDKYAKLLSLSKGEEANQARINALKQIAKEALEREQKIRTTIVQDLGQVGALQVEQNENIQQASIEAQRYGVELGTVVDMVSDLSSALGRNVFISDDDISRLSIFSQAMGIGTGSAADMAKYFDQMGFSISEAIDKGNEMATVARQMGVNVSEFMNTVTQNMDMMNTYNFADGVQGFAKMAAQAQKLGISMSTTASLAEKVMDPEGAIELAANLQVIGGAVGDLADPFKMMYMATNDLAGLQDSLVQAGQELAMFNEETGEISFPPTAQRQLRAMADALGMSKDEFASMIKLQTKFKNMQNQFSFELEGREDMQEFVTSMASLNQQTGKYEIKVPGLDKAVEIEDLTSNQLDKLKEVQDQQQMTEKELMAEQTGILKSIENALKATDVAILGGVAEGLNASELATTLSQSISDALSGNELGKLSDSIAAFTKIGAESVFGAEMESLVTGIKDAANVVQAIIGTGGGGISDLFNLMTEASQKDFDVAQGTITVDELKELKVNGGTPKNDFELAPGDAKAVFTGSGDFILPSMKDTVTGVDLTAGAKGANLGSLVSNTGSVPEKVVKLEFKGLPSKIPLELNGINMGDFNWKKLLDNQLFLQYLKSTLEGIDLTTAPGISDMTQNVRTGIRGQGIG